MDEYDPSTRLFLPPHLPVWKPVWWRVVLFAVYRPIRILALLSLGAGAAGFMTGGHWNVGGVAGVLIALFTLRQGYKQVIGNIRRSVEKLTIFQARFHEEVLAWSNDCNTYLANGLLKKIEAGKVVFHQWRVLPPNIHGMPRPDPATLRVCGWLLALQFDSYVSVLERLLWRYQQLMLFLQWADWHQRLNQPLRPKLEAWLLQHAKLRDPLVLWVATILNNASKGDSHSLVLLKRQEEHFADCERRRRELEALWAAKPELRPTVNYTGSTRPVDYEAQQREQAVARYKGLSASAFHQIRELTAVYEDLKARGETSRASVVKERVAELEHALYVSSKQQ